MKTNHSGWLQVSRAAASFCAFFLAGLAHGSTVATPVFSPVAGTYTSAQLVTITSATSGASINYTTDGSTPSATAGNPYSGPLTLSSTTTLKAIAYKTGFTNSALKSGTYTIKVIAPVFSPAAGTYTSAQSVTITSATSDALINYTTDGSTPSATAGNPYSGPLTLSSTTTLKAIAYESGLANSTVTSGTYTINLPTAATPVFSPVASTYTSVQTVTITSATSGASINYTTDGSTPSATAGNPYSGPLTLSSTTTLKAIAYATGFKNSAVRSGTYTINLPTAAAPIFSPAAGAFTSAQTVTITTMTSGASIRYTTDGSTPSATTGTLYSGPVSIGTTTTLEAVAYKINFNNSTVTSGTYTITLPPAITSSLTAIGEVDSAFSYQIAASYNATSYNATGLPPGLSVNTSTGLINGTPTTAGTTNITISASNSGGVGSATLVLTVNPEPVTFTISPVSFTYNGSAQGPTISPSISDATYSISGTASATSAGSYTVTATATGNYTGTSGPIAWTIAQATPVIAWSPPAPIVYGTTLDSTELNATADVPGVFAYSPATGTVLDVGTQTLSVAFTPTDTADYNNASASVSLTVNAEPVTFIVSPVSFVYNASAQGPTITPSISGATYAISGTASATSAGSYTVTATATGNYTGTSGAIAWTIAQATPVITWSPPAPIVYGTALDSTQLNATANVPGAFAYVPAAGTVPNVGTQTLSVAFTPTDAIDYNNASTSVSLTVNPPPPSTPIFSPAGGSFTSGQSVSITSLGADSIYYTTDGTAPTTASTLYTGAVTVSNNTVLNAIGVNSGGNSSVGTASFTILPPAPSFTPAPGTYTNVTSFSVTISDAASATIYYTTDGSTPTTGSTQYTAPVSLPFGTTTLSAIAVTANGPSTVTAGTYILTPPPPSTPIFSPAGGSFTSGQSVSITSLGATAIYYTTDGSASTTASTLYTGAITVSNNTVLNAIGVNSGGNSSVGTASFTILPPAPSFTPAPGTYTNVTSFSVTISDAASATIYYTTDGSTPTTGSTQYTAPVSLPFGTTTLSAIAVTANGSSTVTAGTYILTPPPPLTPVFSPSGGSFTSAQSVSITSLGADSIYYTTDGTAPTTSSTLYTGAISISNNTVLEAIGVNSGGISPVGTASFTILPPAPTFNPAPGTYTNVTTFLVTITDAASSTIYYTTDGSTPTTASTPYTTPVSLPIGTTTLSAIAVTANGSSAVTAGTYILTPPPPLAPTFSPSGGTYNTVQSVTITSLGATAIYYTTDGSTPTTSSTLYTGTVTISSNTLLQAIGVNSGGSSSVASAGFTIILPVAPLVFSPAPGTYPNAQTVTITTATGGATIRYTTDGSTPTETNGTTYVGPINIASTTMLKAIAYETGFTDGAVAGGLYTVTSSPAATVNVLYDFTAANNVGYYPGSALIQDSAGNFYGTTQTGGSGGEGAVFMMNPAGVATTLVSFNGANGSYPFAGLVRGSDGNFYGTTTAGGSNYYGTVFKMTPSGVLTSLVLFNGPTGNQPYAGLVQASDGNFYGTTASGGGSFNDGTVFKMTPAGALTTLVSFTGTTGTYGATPYAGLVQASNGSLYGTTSGGGPSNAGMIYTLVPSGSNWIFYTVFSFNGTNGQSPNGLVQGSDGNFYGTTASGGTGGKGTIFEFSSNSGVLTTLVSFNGTNGICPTGPLVQGRDGNFYGTTSGDSITSGTIFKMTPAGVLTTLASFDGANGSSPGAALVQGSDGNFYSTTVYGGAFHGGVLFQLIVPVAAAPVFTPAAGIYANTPTVAITSATNGVSIRYTTNGSTPTETNGALYSGPVSITTTTTLKAIAYAAAVADSPVTSGIYNLNSAAPVFSPAAGTFTGAQTVSITSATSNASIRYTTDGSTPAETIGTLYSGPVYINSTTLLKAIAYKSGFTDSAVTNGIYTIGSLPADSLNVLYNFTSSNNGGVESYGGLVQGNDGNFYGTTEYGGSVYDGTVFKMTPAGALTLLASFTGANGANPMAGLLQGSDGNFYGTTAGGGSASDGTVFKMTPAGVLTTLVSFTGANGNDPAAGLIQGTDGNFYGTTFYGGSASYGTVFKMTPAGVLTTLVSFTGANGLEPGTRLVQGSDGNFYGTTAGGGSGSDGTVFKMTPAGVLTTLVSFTGANGNDPAAGLIQGIDGNFYGTTQFGGSAGDGNVFKMTPAGVLTNLVSFTGANGGNPETALVQGSDGNFYGATVDGGSSNAGTVFVMTPAGVLTTLVSFDIANGRYPHEGLVQGSDSNFYGTTSAGGSSNNGAIFQLILPH